MLTIDSREHKLIELLIENNIDFETENLECGDIQIYNETSNYKLIIERKTVDDYVQSRIVDNRLNNQVIKMKESNASCLMFIIEGNNFDGKTISSDSILKSINKLMLFHNFNVVYTENLLHTYNNILYFTDIVMNESPQEFNFKLENHINNKSNKNYFMSALMCLPGISKKTACKICDKYKNINELLNGINTEEIKLNKKQLMSIQELCG